MVHSDFEIAYIRCVPEEVNECRFDPLESAPLENIQHCRHLMFIRGCILFNISSMEGNDSSELSDFPHLISTSGDALVWILSIGRP
ncbi:hypothetical protein AVEN_221154-1 [Araneus ventricosus]|uniref:Uncharacterized protein n=1 Tax=Araneus ventricosus TaxID=182803 RepID=A0A4Y2TWF9_ARAVE|nr:hypothetical protein AVEN_221154-1 [Araneus ventricosus]